MAAGKPVISFSRGGAAETIVEGVSGVFFDKQTPQAIIETVKRFDPSAYKAEACRSQAKKFSKEEFKERFKFFVEEAWQKRSNL